MTFFAAFDANTLAKKQAIKAAGCTHVVISAFWDRLQNGGPGTALESGGLADLNAEFDDARTVGLTPILENGVQYPPAWVTDTIEPFRDQGGHDWITEVGSGADCRNWIWTANGRAAIGDYYTKVAAGLTTTNRAAVDRVRFGGGYFGEVQYPVEQLSSPWSYWGFGASMQTGTGLATGLTACPLPDYVPFTGSDAQDVQWINWYLRGLEDFVRFQIQVLKDAGWTVPLHCLHPGFSIRTNQTRADAGYRQSMAAGHDFTRAVGVYKNDPQVWPWNTSAAEEDAWSPVTVDSDQAPWKKLYAEAAVRGKHHLLWGENGGGENNAGMDFVFDTVIPAGPLDGLIYAGPNPGEYQGYRGFVWLNYDSLVAGGGDATLSRYATRIADL